MSLLFFLFLDLFWWLLLIQVLLPLLLSVHLAQSLVHLELLIYFFVIVLIISLAPFSDLLLLFSHDHFKLFQRRSLIVIVDMLAQLALDLFLKLVLLARHQDVHVHLLLYLVLNRFFRIFQTGHFLWLKERIFKIYFLRVLF